MPGTLGMVATDGTVEVTVGTVVVVVVVVVSVGNDTGTETSQSRSFTSRSRSATLPPGRTQARPRPCRAAARSAAPKIELDPF